MCVSPPHTVEHYRKTRSAYTEDPLRANELRITGAGKVRDLSIRASHLLKVQIGIVRERVLLL